MNEIDQIFVHSSDTATDPLSKLCDISDWDDKSFADLASKIMAGKPGYAIKHRKLWEFTMAVRALGKTGMLDQAICGLSVAGGRERLLYYLANQVGRIVVTDVYGSGSFAKNEAELAFLSSPEKYAPYPYPQQHLVALWMDGRRLLFPDGLFDFALSLSSLEHFGGIKHTIQALKEMNRVVKPGGVVVFTTECSLNGKRGYEIFLPSDILRMIEASGLRLEHPIDWSQSKENCQHILDMRSDNLNVEPHINLKSRSALFTSICVVLRKPVLVTQKSVDRNFVAFDRQIAEIKKSRLVPKTFVLEQAWRWLRTKILSAYYRVEELLTRK